MIIVILDGAEKTLFTTSEGHCPRAGETLQIETVTAEPFVGRKGTGERFVLTTETFHVVRVYHVCRIGQITTYVCVREKPVAPPARKL